MAERRGGIWKVGLGALTALVVLALAGPASAFTCAEPSPGQPEVCGSDFSVPPGDTYSGVIGTTDLANGSPVTVDWGDGATGPAFVFLSEIYPTSGHLYAGPGVYTVTVTAFGRTGTGQATVSFLCDGKTATIYRGSGYPGTTGSDGTAMNVTGTRGDDVIVGDSNQDTLKGGGGDDTICGGPGNDTIYDNDGTDEVFGEGGKDTLYAGLGADVLSGGGGTDVVSYRLRNTDVSATLGLTTTNGAAEESDDIAGNIENLTGGTGNDTLTGDAGSNVISGGNGSDSISGLAGNDTLSDGPGSDTGVDGGEDNDTLIAGTGRDPMNGGTGRDHLTYAGRSDGVSASFSPTPPPGFEDIFTQEDIEKLSGSQGNDTLQGSDNADTIYGEGGADNIDSFSGNDTLLDGPGDDQVSGGPGNDTFYPGAGADVLDGDDGTADLVSYRFRTDAVTAYLGVDDASGTTIPAEGDSIGSTVENLGGGSGNDNLTGGTGPDVIFGNGGDDTVSGFFGNDRLSGNGGNDTLLDGFGSDDMFGGSGDDGFTTQLDSEVDDAACGDGNDNVSKGEASDTAAADCENVMG